MKKSARNALSKSVYASLSEMINIAQSSDLKKKIRAVVREIKVIEAVLDLEAEQAAMKEMLSTKEC